MSNTIKTKIKLRKDIEANYDLVRNSFIPENGEVCIVDMNGTLKFKVGDGLHYFGSLPYIESGNDVVGQYYYFNGKFYTDSTYTVEVPKANNHLYIDKSTNKTYIWNGVSYVPNVPMATESVAGLIKLYNEHGNNIDGTMTQRSITYGVNNIELAIAEDDPEMLVISSPWE